MSFTFSVTCRETTHKIKVLYQDKLSWGWLTSECLRLHNIAKDYKKDAWGAVLNRMVVHGLVISYKGIVLQSLEYSNIITSSSVDETGLNHPFQSKQLMVITESYGYYRIKQENGLLQHLIEYLDLSQASQLSTLMMISKEFNTIASTDKYWKQVFIKNDWRGVGSDGSEDDEWDNYRIHYGLPYYNTLRIRYIQQSNSRLKIFYGSLLHWQSKNKKTTPPVTNSSTSIHSTISSILSYSIFSWLNSNSSQSELFSSSPVQKNIVFIIGIDGSDCAKNIHRYHSTNIYIYYLYLIFISINLT